MLYRLSAVIEAGVIINTYSCSQLNTKTGSGVCVIDCRNIQVGTIVSISVGHSGRIAKLLAKLLSITDHVYVWLRYVVVHPAVLSCWLSHTAAPVTQAGHTQSSLAALLFVDSQNICVQYPHIQIILGVPRVANPG